MFDTKLIPNSNLPAGYTLRPLQREDFQRGYASVLKTLTEVGEVSESDFNQLYDYWATAGTNTNNAKAPRIFYPIVIEFENRVVATGMLLVEQKLIHSCARAGHIEDICVDPQQQGKQLGRRVIEALTHIAKQVDCYKVILDCDEKNVGFYERCGYSRAGVEMQIR